MSATEARGVRRRARRGEGEKLRDEILHAAEALLLETGDEEAVSIRAVADAVGVTPPSIYLHFSDKNEMLFAVCERHFDELDRVIQAAGERAEDPLESLFLRGRAYIRFGLDRPEHYRILFMGKAAALPAGFEEMRLRRMAAFDHLVEAVERCMDSGAIARRDPYLAALGLWAAGHGLTSLLISKPTFTWPDLDLLIDHVLSVQIYGLASPPSR